MALGAFVIVFLLTLREYFTEGVITHHLLAREDLPGFSNWWGLLTIPLLAIIVAALIKHRRRRAAESEIDREKHDKIVFRRLLAALLFGLTVSLLWELNLEFVLPYFILLPLLLAFFIPVYLPEYLFGFVLGMIYSFGGILPIIIGLVLLILSFIIHKIVGFIKSLAT